MTETKLTQNIKRALIIKYSSAKYTSGTFKTNYGALEVPCGKWIGKGKENIDMACYAPSTQMITCCEVKITKADFNSKANLSFYGNRNYLVAPTKLAQYIVDIWKNNPDEFDKCTHAKDMRVSGCGVMAFDPLTAELSILAPCKKQNIHFAQKMALIEGILRAGCRDAEKYYQLKK